MQIPYRIEFTRPTRRDLRRAIGRRSVQVALAALVIGSGTAAAIGRSEWQQARALRGAIAITSVPTGATVAIDGHGTGRSPEVRAVSPGDHAVAVGGPPLAEQLFSVQVRSHATTRLSANLWRATPVVNVLRPPLPGTQIDRVGFLGNGQVWLSVAMPAATTRQLWRLDRHGLPVPLGPASLPAPVAPSPGGTLLAYLATPATDGATPSPVLIVAPVAGRQTPRRYVLPLRADAAITDLAWAPDGRHVLIVATRDVGGQAVDALVCWLDVGDGPVRTLLELPSSVVAGSEVWRPDSGAVAFLARTASGATLCLLDTGSGRLRSLADLPGNPPPLFAPLAWAPDGPAVYAAAVPVSRSGIGDLLAGQATATALFLLPDEDAPARRLPVTGATNPAWQADGSVLAVTTQAGHAPALQTFDLASGHSWSDGALLVPGAGALALHWDVTHAQALAARSDAVGASSYWLLSFSSEVYP